MKRVRFFFILTIVLPAHARLLPHAGNRAPRAMKNYFTRPLKTQDIPLDIREFENMMIRKHGTLPIFILLKKPAEVLPVQNFDENGMLFLTQPKRNMDRGLIRILNEILKDKKIRNNFVRKYGDERIKIPKTEFEFTDLVS